MSAAPPRLSSTLAMAATAALVVTLSAAARAEPNRVTLHVEPALRGTMIYNYPVVHPSLLFGVSFERQAGEQSHFGAELRYGVHSGEEDSIYSLEASARIFREVSLGHKNTFIVGPALFAQLYYDESFKIWTGGAYLHSELASSGSKRLGLFLDAGYHQGFGPNLFPHNGDDEELGGGFYAVLGFSYRHRLSW